MVVLPRRLRRSCDLEHETHVVNVSAVVNNLLLLCSLKQQEPDKHNDPVVRLSFFTAQRMKIYVFKARRTRSRFWPTLTNYQSVTHSNQSGVGSWPNSGTCAVGFMNNSGTCAAGFMNNSGTCAAGFMNNSGTCAVGFMNNSGTCAAGFMNNSGTCAAGFMNNSGTCGVGFMNNSGTCAAGFMNNSGFPH